MKHDDSVIDQLWPLTRSSLTDEQILELYAPPTTPWLRMNFISSLDGAATRDGRSGGLGDTADRRVFELLRYWADVVLLGAGTARDEAYGAMILADAAVQWRIEHGLKPHPVFALVSRHLDLDPASPIFTAAPVRPIIFTVSSAPQHLRHALSECADIIDTGETSVDPITLRDQLHTRGHMRIHSEGGPTLFGAFINAGVIDELCLTLAPSLEAGAAPRIAHEETATPTRMSLETIMRAGDELLFRYRADDSRHSSSAP